MDELLTPQRPDLIAEANHRIANSLTLLSGLARMQARHVGRSAQSFSNAQVRLMFEGFAARISTVGQLHRMLAHMPPDGTVDLSAHLRDLSSVLVAAFASDQQQIRIEHHGMDCHVLARNVQPLTLVLCEIITNALKYAHPSGVPVHLIIRCEGAGNGDLLVSISDDGVGLPEDFDSSKDGSVGFQIIRALTAEMGATLNVSSDNLGATFRLAVPQTFIANAQTA